VSLQKAKYPVPSNDLAASFSKSQCPVVSNVVAAPYSKQGTLFQFTNVQISGKNNAFTTPGHGDNSSTGL